MNTSTLQTPLEKETVIRSRIRLIGKLGRLACSGLLVLSGIGFCLLIYILIAGAGHLTKTPSVSMGEWSYSAGKPATALICTAVWAFWVGGFWLMRTVFVQFTREEIFTQRTARCIKWLGAWSLAQVLSFSPVFLLIGSFLIALGWVMELAAAMKQEQDLTV